MSKLLSGGTPPTKQDIDKNSLEYRVETIEKKLDMTLKIIQALNGQVARLITLMEPNQ